MTQGATPLRAVTLGGLAALLFLAACSSPETTSSVEFHVPVSVREIGTGSVEERVVATGTLRAAESVALRADTSGVLHGARTSAGRRLEEGDRVQAGQVIAEITGEDVKLAARTEATFQRYETARRDYDSKKALFDQGLLSAIEFRQLEAALADAKLDLDRSRLTESRSRLTTPISGILLRLGRDAQGLPVADGQLVPQGFEVAQIASTSELVADVDIVGPDVARVRPALPVRVRHHAWEDRTFEGSVLRLAPTLDPATRSLLAQVAVKNSEGLLRPGMFVEVTVVVERRQDVPVIPREALTERGGSKVVFVLDGQRVKRREVVLGLGDDDVVEVRQGAKVGERVVIRGLETLTDGTKVRVTGA